MAITAALTPWRALVLMTKSMLGPGVAETTNVIRINSHQVLRVMKISPYRWGKPIRLVANPEIIGV
jgi:hypothetical protein